MKNYSFTLFVLSIAFFLTTTLSVKAQSSSGVSYEATVNPSWVITVDNKADLHAPIHVYVRPGLFRTPTTGVSFAGAISDNLIGYSYDASSGVLTLNLHFYPGGHVNTVAEWNTYLAGLAPHYSSLYTAINR
jgi:hypothetical protein